MKVYRIVADVVTKGYEGCEFHFYADKPRFCEGNKCRCLFRRKEDALRACEEIKRKCAVFDKMTQARYEQNPGSIWTAFYQSNIRVQERDITDWIDCEV